MFLDTCMQAMERRLMTKLNTSMLPTWIQGGGLVNPPVIFEI